MVEKLKMDKLVEIIHFYFSILRNYAMFMLISVTVVLEPYVSGSRTTWFRRRSYSTS